jgi:hypothetical protein
MEITPHGIEEVVVVKGLEQFIGKFSKEELVSMYSEQFSKLEGKVAKSEQQDYAVTAVINEIRKQDKKKNFTPKQKAIPFIGFVIGDKGYIDKIDTMKRVADAYERKWGQEMAVGDGYKNEEGQYLDTRKQLFGKDNDNLGLPLADDVVDVSRTLCLIAKLNEELKFKYGVISTSDAPLARGWGKIPFYRPAQSFGLVKMNSPKPLTAEDKEKMSDEDIENYEKQNGEFKLNASGAEDTTSIFKAINPDLIDVTKTFLEVIGPRMTAVANVERDYEYIKDVKAYERIMFVKGRVSWINRKSKRYGENVVSFGLMDTNGNTVSETTVIAQPNLFPDIGELSEVVVIGCPSRGSLKEVDDNTGQVTWLKNQGAVEIKAYGIFVLKATPSDVYSAEQLGSPKEIEGWVP